MKFVINFLQKTRLIISNLITKLQNLSFNANRNELYFALKGLSIFLPLETDKTINHERQTLPAILTSLLIKIKINQFYGQY